MIKTVSTTVLLLLPRVAAACPVCFGQSDSPLAKAINMGVVMMLGVVAVMLGSFATFFVYLNRRAKQVAEDVDSQGYSSARASTNPQEGTAQC